MKLANWLHEPPPFPWRLAFVTPLRLRRQGRYLSRIDWPFFLSNVVQRLEMLMVSFQDGKPMGAESWQQFHELFQQPARILDDLSWCDWSRYSNRQKQKVFMGGLVGGVTIEEAPRLWWPFWQAATLANVGKGAAMGLGRVECVSRHSLSPWPDYIST
jgi:hypothetical protein